MSNYTALLRGINVGGNNIIPMKELKAMCERIGFKNVRTYIQSGNVVFESNLSVEKAAGKLEKELLTKVGKNIHVVTRTSEEMVSVVSKNPFPKENPSKVAVWFFSDPVPGDYLKGFVNEGPEKIILSKREMYIYYPDGMGKSKLKLPKMKEQGTARNINTITRLAEMGKNL